MGIDDHCPNSSSFVANYLTDRNWFCSKYVRILSFKFSQSHYPFSASLSQTRNSLAVNRQLNPLLSSMQKANSYFHQANMTFKIQRNTQHWLQYSHLGMISRLMIHNMLTINNYLQASNHNHTDHGGIMTYNPA